ncbi:sensor histidine kinase [Microbacterium sp. JZ31]|uniref:sensor histidine kinase n=1 Tax=Microbacterium sp. JZ31 TaxID=1906274 RepID=UPI0019313ED8|nr:HAMP domain-containing sensor histidine kinase [Microbacterium sp. JZ31]
MEFWGARPAGTRPGSEAAGAGPDSRTRSIWLNQLALTATVVVISLVVQGLTPGRITSWTFVAGVALIMTVTMIALAVPWHRLRRHAVAAIPLADILGIGLMSAGDELRLAFLWVVPIVWIATHFSLAPLVAALAGIVAIMLTDLALTGGSDAVALHIVVTELCLTFIGLTAHAGARQTRAFKRLLRAQAARIQTTLDRVSEQERNVSLMINAIDVGIVRLSADGELMAMNDTYARLHGIDPRDPWHPARAIEYGERGGRPLPEPERPLQRAARGETFDDERVWLFDAAGEWRALSVAARRLEGGEAEPPSVLLVVHDVTALIESERVRQRIAAVVSHELRNPLTAVIGHAELGVEDAQVPDAARRKFDTIRRAGERMERLLDQVLRAPAQPVADHEPGRAELRSILESSVESFQPTATARGLRLELDAPDTVLLAGDGFRLRQVIDNLISNAIKYTPREGVIRVSCRTEREEVAVTVTDTGIGIAREDVGRVFEAYFRAQTARDSEIPGTGLGMAIAREIVVAHAGSLDVASEPGVGTTVTVRLPLAAAEVLR